ncbi:Stf0 family sulfotransferase [Tropicimonas sp. IMCC6043]|uniref:Stf0 family sulfotransferase n=1 Tax=Tropicimonas sp. IMCC6043 TaxID=2510645 RepID=UPI00101C49C9|nr:Stf0 family sulfotransferase [Tropicimonas sp. IMCC6043]RYH08103.1 sulfotransferase [Tropicimonas sp. IMCC6043]
MSRIESYILCTSPRSGSTMLCSLLEASGVAGSPDSHFHTPSLARWLATYDIRPDATMSETDALRAVLKAAIAHGRGETDVFGLRLQRQSFDFFVRQLALLHPGLTGDRARIEAAFGPTLFIHLTRQNKLDQAISFEKARQSGLWHRAPDGTELERLSPPRTPHYDSAALRARQSEFEAFDSAWEAWFAAEGISPLRLSYNSLAEDPRACLALVLASLGLDPAAADGIVPGTARLADETSLDWKRRLLDDISPS